MTYTLNLLDLLLTLHALSLGCMELNPLLQSIPTMVAYKVIIVGVLVWWLEHVADINVGNKKGCIARWGLSLCTVVYLLTNINHIVNLIVIGVIF